MIMPCINSISFFERGGSIARVPGGNIRDGWPGAPGWTITGGESGLPSWAKVPVAEMHPTAPATKTARSDILFKAGIILFNLPRN